MHVCVYIYIYAQDVCDGKMEDLVGRLAFRTCGSE